MEKYRFCVVALAVLILPLMAQGQTPTPTNIADQSRVIARFGIQPDKRLQEISVVKKMSQLIEQNPKTTSYGISFSIDKDTFKVLEYNRQRRQLVFTTVARKGDTSGTRISHFYPAVIHKAAQKSLNIDDLIHSKRPRS